MSDVKETTVGSIDFGSDSMVRNNRRRLVKDKLAALGIGAGGNFVIVAVLLIFFYLLYEVVPLFAGAHVEEAGAYSVPAPQQGKTLYLAAEEQTEIGLRITDQGRAVFFDAQSGEVKLAEPLLEGAQITAFAADEPSSRVLAVGLQDGRALVFKHSYKATFYENNRRVLTPYIEYHYGREPVVVDPQGQPLKQLSVRDTEVGVVLAAVTADERIVVTRLDKEEDFFSGEIQLIPTTAELPSHSSGVLSMLISPDLRWLFIANLDSQMDVYDLDDMDQPVLNARLQLSEAPATVTSVEFLLGGLSLLVGDSSGQVSQWFLVRDEANQYALKRIRDFQQRASAIVALAPEHRRKGFMALDAEGHLGLYNATAHRSVYNETLFSEKIMAATLAPRANAALVQTDDGKIHRLDIENEHPEVSWSALWSKVWYESYDQPEFIWQSSAANNDFEPKFSLAPLAFGTLKAAFYAMLLAAPLAICGAMYTAFFMAPALRKKVKPVVELMEALPTVILGFLAGLWLAPFVEKNLAGIFALLLLTPIGVVAFGFTWANLPARIRLLLPDGWSAVLAIPVVLFLGAFSLWLGGPLENMFFNGDMRTWLSNDLGVTFDQRNSIVVGLAMGFAVIPTIFSIAEDALFSVPRHLVNGSLALAASPWQTLVRVVLPTASPGIFSAVMIGLGRAVGETMIVLMATGNTPIMDVNIFEGMRTLAANIAVEMPESEVGSTHYRILFMAAFVLFLFTFVFNTVAEIVRQRLRVKYGSL